MLTGWQTSVIYLIGGLIGGVLKAWASNSQDLRSRKTAVDVVISGLVGLLWPSLGPIPLPSGAGVNVIQQAGFIAFVSYAASHLVTNVVEKFEGGAVAKVVAWFAIGLTLSGCTAAIDAGYAGRHPGSLTISCGDGASFSAQGNIAALVYGSSNAAGIQCKGTVTITNGPPPAAPAAVPTKP